MLSRSNGRHKITFQKHRLSFNYKFTNLLIIGAGVVSSLAALLMIMEFMGLKPDYLNVLDISNRSISLVADSLAKLGQALITNTASI